MIRLHRVEVELQLLSRLAVYLKNCACPESVGLQVLGRLAVYLQNFSCSESVDKVAGAWHLVVVVTVVASVVLALLKQNLRTNFEWLQRCSWAPFDAVAAVVHLVAAPMCGGSLENSFPFGQWLSVYFVWLEVLPKED